MSYLVICGRTSAHPLDPASGVLLVSGQVKMVAMSIYRVLRKAERFGVSFHVCDSKDVGVGSCDQFLTELSLRDCSVFTQRAYAIGLAHFFSWLHASGGEPDRVTRQILGSYVTGNEVRPTAHSWLVDLRVFFSD